MYIEKEIITDSGAPASVWEIKEFRINSSKEGVILEDVWNISVIISGFFDKESLEKGKRSLQDLNFTIRNKETGFLTLGSKENIVIEDFDPTKTNMEAIYQMLVNKAKIFENGQVKES